MPFTQTAFWKMQEADYKTGSCLTPVVAVLLYVGYGFCNLWLVSNLPLNCWILYQWIFLVGIYLFIRLNPHPDRWLLLLSTIGLIQAVCVMLQQLDWITSNHSQFQITGFMANPGPLGGFQAICFIANTMLLKRDSFRYIPRPLLLISLLITTYSLLVADSRAGWIAAGIGLLWLYRTPILHVLKKHYGYCFLFLCLIISICAALIAYRPESVQARLLIWRVACDMIIEKPLFGHGIGQFALQYMHYQATYFSEHPDSIFTMVADNVSHPYNEILHLFVEQGLVGVILLCTLFRQIVRHTTDRSLLAPLITLLTFALFSYPSYTYWLLLLFPFLIALPSSTHEQKKSIDGSLLRYCVLSATLVAGCLNGWIHYKATAYSSAMMSKYESRAAAFLQQHANYLISNPRYNGKFLLWYIKYPPFRSLYQPKQFIPTCERWCALGDHYAQSGAFQEALLYYQEAARMIPTRIAPKFKLWELYLQQGCLYEASAIAKQLLSQPIKVENSYTIRAKYTIRHYYQQHPEHLVEQGAQTPHDAWQAACQTLRQQLL